MATCACCGLSSPLVSEALGLCLRCLRSRPDDAHPHIQRAHAAARAEFDLPAQPPKSPGGIACSLCANECRMAPGERGYCGVRANQDGRLVGSTPQRASVEWYHDALPTNCVADWVCPGGTGAGYPTFAHCDGPERGYKNLAVFYRACSFDCLFCQNWHFRQRFLAPSPACAEELADAVDPRTSCICYFGGDPGPQLPHALRASRLALQANPGRILRICWETNGSMNPSLLEKMADLSWSTGGCVKFDLKAFDDGLHRALCGVSNRRTLENFQALGRRIAQRPDPPPLVASTLLVPGHIDTEEVSRIARFIASVSPDIPYALLAFHADFMMHDLPPTSRSHAEACQAAALEAGVRRVRIGNVAILGPDYETFREGDLP